VLIYAIILTGMLLFAPAVFVIFTVTKMKDNEGLPAVFLLAAFLITGLGLVALFHVTPYDWLLGRVTVVPFAKDSNYQCTIVQKPGYDFYETWLEVRRIADNKVARLPLDLDDHKLRGARVKVVGTRYELGRLFDARELVRVDLSKHSAFTAIAGERPIESLEFK
jgi:hypothetical protein